MIAGAGHNGLMCAAQLAAAGVPVTVFEQAQRPGGAVSAFADTLPAFRHDTCAGFSEEVLLKRTPRVVAA